MRLPSDLPLQIDNPGLTARQTAARAELERAGKHISQGGGKYCRLVPVLVPADRLTEVITYLRARYAIKQQGGCNIVGGA